MSFESRELKLIEATILSGSSDTLRTALGAAWIQNSSSESGETLSPYSSPIFMWTSSPYIHNMSVLDPAHAVEHIYYSADYAQPIIKYPVRLYGSDENVKSDDHWRKYLNGGEFQGQVYEGVFSRQEFTNHLFNYSLPYTILEAKESSLQNYGVINDIEVSYDYNYYLPKYEEYTSALDSELLIPNVYFLQMINEVDEVSTSTEQARVHYDEYVLNFYSREDAVNSWASVFRTELDLSTRPASYASFIPGTATTVGEYREHEYIVEYLSKDFIRNPVSSSTEMAIKTKFKNIMLDDLTLESQYIDVLQNKHLVPWYTKIKFEASPGGTFARALRDNNFSSKFLVSLKDTFGQSPTGPAAETKSFVTQEKTHLSITQEINEIYTKDLRTVDFGDLINHARLNYLAPAEDYCFVGRRDKLSRQSAMDTTGIYRYINTVAATKMLAQYFDFCDDLPLLQSIANPYRKLDADTETAAVIVDADLFTTQSLHISPNVETVAYRVEKLKSTTQEVIQDFWIANTPNMYDRTAEELIIKDIDFVDSQVKYGEEYTYNVYAYTVVAGYRYQTSELITTKRIADIDPDLPAYCLQFHDPETDDVRNRLFIDDDFSITEENEYATDAQITSPHKYVADFYMSVQPSLMLVEMPVTTKTLRVLDNPPNTISALPFKVEDASRRLGFDLQYRAFEEKPFPVVITTEDQTYKTDYLNANNLLEDEPLKNETVSEPRYLEVYRIQTKPESYTEFAGALIKTIDMRVESPPTLSPGTATTTVDFRNTYKDYIFYDKVNTNQKYYYMFRFLNEHMNLNRSSLIYEAELVDDGGYLYGIFDTFFIEDLEQPTFIKPSISFKKLINLVPNIQHMLFDDSEVDYTQEALSQIENFKIGNKDSAIWGRKFKIRLTSKKTGKKIDLNITYDLT